MEITSRFQIGGYLETPPCIYGRFSQNFRKLQINNNQKVFKRLKFYENLNTWQLERYAVRMAPKWPPLRLHFWVPLGRRRSGRQRFATTSQEWSEWLCNWWSNLTIQLGTFQLDESENRCLCQEWKRMKLCKKRGELLIVVNHLGRLVRQREPSDSEIW